VTAPTINAIDTEYAGCRFRSRLEARWAVYFDALGIAWQYEPQGFHLSAPGKSGTYLPDFYLPALDLWVEVKGSEGRMDWDLLALASGGLPESRWARGEGSAIIVLGEIPRPEDGLWAHPVVSRYHVNCTRVDLAALDHRGLVSIGGSPAGGPMDLGWTLRAWEGDYEDWTVAAYYWITGRWSWDMLSWESDSRPSIHGMEDPAQVGGVPKRVRQARTAARSARFAR